MKEENSRLHTACTAASARIPKTRARHTYSAPLAPPHTTPTAHARISRAGHGGSALPLPSTAPLLPSAPSAGRIYHTATFPPPPVPPHAPPLLGKIPHHTMLHRHATRLACPSPPHRYISHGIHRRRDNTCAPLHHATACTWHCRDHHLPAPPLPLPLTALSAASFSPHHTTHPTTT